MNTGTVTPPKKNSGDDTPDHDPDLDRDEICGGQTHTIVKYGIESLLPPRADAGARSRLPRLRHPPGIIDKAIAIASRSESYSPPSAICSASRVRRRTSSRSKPKGERSGWSILRSTR